MAKVIKGIVRGRTLVPVDRLLGPVLMKRTISLRMWTKTVPPLVIDVTANKEVCFVLLREAMVYKQWLHQAIRIPSQIPIQYEHYTVNPSRFPSASVQTDSVSPPSVCWICSVYYRPLANEPPLCDAASKDQPTIFSISTCPNGYSEL